MVTGLIGLLGFRGPWSKEGLYREACYTDRRHCRGYNYRDVIGLRILRFLCIWATPERHHDTGVLQWIRRYKKD